MKEKIITLLFCMFLASSMVFISCDNGEPPVIEDGDIEKDFIKDYGAVKDNPEDVFDSALETEIGKLQVAEQSD